MSDAKDRREFEALLRKLVTAKEPTGLGMIEVGKDDDNTSESQYLLIYGPSSAFDALDKLQPHSQIADWLDRWGADHDLPVLAVGFSDLPHTSYDGLCVYPTEEIAEEAARRMDIMIQRERAIVAVDFYLSWAEKGETDD